MPDRIGGKSLCLFDIRSNTQSQRIGAKSPHALAISPHEPYMLACNSRLTAEIEFYDLRQFSGMTCHVSDANVTQMSWCPTR